MIFKSINDITPITLRQYRKEKGISQRDFWEAIHVSKGTGCRIESGQKILTDSLRLLVLETYGEKDDAVTKARKLLAEAVALLSPGTPEVNEEKK